MASKKPKKEAAAPVELPAVYVYIGPSIRGAVQNGTVYTGTRTEILGKLSGIIEKVPEVAALVVEAAEVAEARSQLKEGRGYYAHAFKTIITKEGD